jgi:hypothetical protein
MRMPLFYLCRHAIELRIKYTIVDLAGYSELAPDTLGHNLFVLWNHLLKHTDKVGLPTCDEYTMMCQQFVIALNEADPDGERFRYPTDRKQSAFEYTRVELEGLVNAHFHLAVYCDGAREMLEDRW